MFKWSSLLGQTKHQRFVLALAVIEAIIIVALESVIYATLAYLNSILISN